MCWRFIKSYLKSWLCCSGVPSRVIFQAHSDVTDQLKTPKCSCDGQEMARVLM